MPEQNKNKKSSFPLILIAGGLLLLAAGGYYVYTTYIQTSAEVKDAQESVKKFPLKKIDWQKEVFSHGVFKTLTVEVPRHVIIDVGDVGNDSPFITTR